MTMQDLGFMRGVNLGGWLSQCDYSPARIEGFITEADIERIASWGLDHVRIPVDYNVLEAEAGQEPVGFAALDRAIAWCRARGLRVVIDLHKTAGFCFDPGQKEGGFFENTADQERFYALWEGIAKRYGALHDFVVFELLNEVTETRYIDAWNAIARECVRRIRVFAPESLILLGGHHNNSAAAVQDLLPPADERVIYNFHCYEPFAFTHQGAYWVDELPRDVRVSFAQSGASEEYFETLLASAVEAARRNHTSLYCGEYGVIDQAPTEEAIRWFETIHRVFERLSIPRCCWSYKEMDFGIGDARWDSLRERLLAAL